MPRQPLYDEPAERVGWYLPASLVAEIDAQAAAEGLNASQLVTRLLRPRVARAQRGREEVSPRPKRSWKT